MLVTRKLTTGAEVTTAAAISARFSLISLIGVHMVAAQEFVLACHDRGHRFADPAVAELLIGKSLVEAVAADGLIAIPQDTRAAIVAATVVEDAEWDFKVRDFEDMFE